MHADFAAPIRAIRENQRRTNEERDADTDPDSDPDGRRFQKLRALAPPREKISTFALFAAFAVK